MICLPSVQAWKVNLRLVSVALIRFAEHCNPFPEAVVEQFKQPPPSDGTDRERRRMDRERMALGAELASVAMQAGLAPVPLPALLDGLHRVLKSEEINLQVAGSLGRSLGVYMRLAEEGGALTGAACESLRAAVKVSAPASALPRAPLAPVCPTPLCSAAQLRCLFYCLPVAPSSSLIIPPLTSNVSHCPLRSGIILRITLSPHLTPPPPSYPSPLFSLLHCLVLLLLSSPSLPLRVLPPVSRTAHPPNC